MKSITGKLKLLAFVGAILVAAIAIQSCKKSSGPSTPIVTNTTLAAGATVTAGTSTGFTITGTNLTNATVTTSATGITITNVTVNAGGTSITGTVSVNVAVASGTVTLTITTAQGTTTATFTVVGLPLLGGYLSSDSVATANLLAYWPFDGDVNDHAGGISGTGVNVSYVPGIRGQAYQGSTTSYASFTPSAAMAGLQSFSLSVWYWQVAQPVSTPNTPQGIFFLADSGGADPLIILENEAYSPVSGDSLRIHNGLVFPAASNYNYFILEGFDTAAIGKWVHFVMTYNGGTSTYVIYQDAVPTLDNSAYGLNLSTILLQGPLGSTPQGNINWSSKPPVEGTIGTWAPGVFGVSPTLGSNGNWAGKLDELRLFNTALTQQQVTGLYLNGLAGR